MKWRPQPKNRANKDIPTIHHFMGPLIKTNPNTNKKIAMAPIYIGPAVNAWGPQYKGICLIIWSAFWAPALFKNLYVSEFLLNAPAEAPPLKFGINRFRDSSIP